MNIAETKDLIGKIKLLWPSSKLGTEHVEEWQKCFHSCSLDDANKGMDAYGREGNRFPPQSPYDVLNRIQLNSQNSEPRDRSAEALHFNYYIKRGLIPLVREHHGRKAFAFMKPESAKIYSVRKENARMFGVSTDIYYED